MLVAASLFVILPATRVAAHTTFIDSTIVDGSVLESAPATVEMRFTEPILLSSSNATLLHLGSDTKDDLALSTSNGATRCAAC